MRLVERVHSRSDSTTRCIPHQYFHIELKANFQPCAFNFRLALRNGYLVLNLWYPVLPPVLWCLKIAEMRHTGNLVTWLVLLMLPKYYSLSSLIEVNVFKMLKIIYEIVIAWYVIRIFFEVISMISLLPVITWEISSSLLLKFYVNFYENSSTFFLLINIMWKLCLM